MNRRRVRSPLDSLAREREAERFYVASSWTLMRRRFLKHRMALVSGSVLLLFYFVGSLFAGFFSTHHTLSRFGDYSLASPQRIRLIHDGRLQRPFVYGLEVTVNPETYRRSYVEDGKTVYPIRFFVHGDEYKLLGVVRSTVRFMGVDQPGTLFLFGTDRLGRDLYSRTVAGARVSLTIGLVGVAVSFVIGCLLGGLSGYLGGPVDMLIQRLIEFLSSLPTLPVWMALAVAVPAEWDPIAVYFMITVILSIVGWTGLARVVRGKLLQLRVEDYVLAAKIAGATELSTIGRHLLPGFMSFLIVHLTLAIPGMIIGETALSFIGVGLRPPAVSWGVLLQQAQNIRSVSLAPWLLIPGIFVLVTVLCFNFIGDGLRDAADPTQDR